MTLKVPQLVELLKAGAHFGHRVGKWHPKMKPFIFTERSGVHIINLEQTQVKLKGALEYVRSLAAAGGLVVFVGTKRQMGTIIRREAMRCGMPYVERRWLGGTITNFGVIRKLIDQYISKKTQEAKGELGKYTKKEQLDIHRDIERMELMVGGIETMTRVPDAVFIVDVKHERTAVHEAKCKAVPIVAVCDTNANIEGIAYPIPANDDALKTVDLLTTLMADAVLEGKAAAKQAAEVAATVTGNG